MKQIYFDSDEDITAIINKLESYESTQVALIPPKRSTTLQSVVNLKLLHKAAKAKENELVVITRDPFILNIASQLSLLTAPNLETEPEVPQPKESRKELPGTVIQGSDVSEKDYTDADQAAETVEDTEETAKDTPVASKKAKNVPDFQRFKKYMLLATLAIFLLGGLLWWALVTAPHATVRIEGITQDVSAETGFKLGPNADEPDLDEKLLPAEANQESRTLSTTFKPTGSKTVGEKATGEIEVFNNCYKTEEPVEFEKGTAFVSEEGYIFRNDVAFEIEAASRAIFGDECTEKKSEVVSVTADEIGEEYNIGSSSYTAKGYPSDPDDGISGNGSNMTGGESEEVTVPTKDDIQQARQRLLEDERASIRETLRKQFDKEQFIIDSSFTEDVTEVSSEPPAGQESEGDARLILQVTYSLMAVDQQDMEDFLEQVYKEEADGGQELGVIDNGLEEADIERNQGGDMVFTLRAEGVLGPDIPEDELKNALAGKSYTEAIDHIESKPSVTTAEVNLSPLWVSSVPDDPDSIDVIFEVADPNADNTGD